MEDVVSKSPSDSRIWLVDIPYARSHFIDVCGKIKIKTDIEARFSLFEYQLSII